MTFEPKRRPKALSYSAWSKFKKDREAYFLQYLAGHKPAREKQEQPAAAGSAFDAYVKDDLNRAVYGGEADPKFAFDTLFVAQVEEQNRDWAIVAGKHIFDNYVASGAHGELLALLKESVEPPQFESSIESHIDDVPFLCKPDLRFMLKRADQPLRVILDWKVMGYCSKYGASPTPGYALCRDAIGWPKPSRSHGKEHKKYLGFDFRGLTINQGYMEYCDEDYANQVSIYGWALGEKPGDENVVVAIDEIAAKYMNGNPPLLRIATHRARVSQQHQLKILAEIKSCWEAVTSGHIFSDMSREDSDSRCEVLEEMAIGLQTDGSAGEDWFTETTRSPHRW